MATAKLFSFLNGDPSASVRYDDVTLVIDRLILVNNTDVPCAIVVRNLETNQQVERTFDSPQTMNIPPGQGLRYDTVSGRGLSTTLSVMGRWPA